MFRRVVILFLLILSSVPAVGTAQCENGQCQIDQSTPFVQPASGVHETANFIVTSHDQAWAQVIAETCEHHRKHIALSWFGRQFQDRQSKIRVTVTIRLGATDGGGATVFQYQPPMPMKTEAPASGTWTGSWEAVRDDVIPHEVMHILLSEKYRMPIQRWMDEGAASCCESDATRDKHRKQYASILATGGGNTSLREMVGMSDYPPTYSETKLFYHKSCAVAEFLVLMGGKQRYMEWFEEVYTSLKYGESLKKIYDVDSIEELDRQWRDWMANGAPYHQHAVPLGEIVRWEANAWVFGRVKQQPMVPVVKPQCCPPPVVTVQPSQQQSPADLSKIEGMLASIDSKIQPPQMQEDGEGEVDDSFMWLAGMIGFIVGGFAFYKFLES